MKVISHEELGANEFGLIITRMGGGHDGLEFRMVNACLEDGTVKRLFISNSHAGYFKQVFVPWDHEHQQAVEV